MSEMFQYGEEEEIMFSPEALQTKLPDFMYKAYVQHEQALAKGDVTPLTPEERMQLFHDYMNPEPLPPISLSDLDRLRLTFPDEWADFILPDNSSHAVLQLIRDAIDEMDNVEAKSTQKKRRAEVEEMKNMRRKM